MKKRVLKLLLMGVTYTFIGFVFQLLFISMLWATETNAQRVKSIKEVIIQVEIQDKTLRQTFGILERQSPFRFVYDKKDPFLAQKFNIEKQTLSMEEVLVAIARENKLKFKQVNNNITVSKPILFTNEIIEIEDTVVEITGKVTDQSGDPIPGVTVSISGTVVGTATDFDGNYSISVPEGSILIFSFIGFESQSVEIGNQSIINITLGEDITSLEEVVIIGYGTAKRKDLTGSVVSLDPSQMETQSTTNLLEFFSGTIAGFNSNQSPNARGGGSMEIRGPTSLKANTNPLVVLDGVIFNGDIADINPNDIESIDVLKDASSAAVFGARAAAGVIIVTTKKGRSEKPVINFNSSVGMTQNVNDLRPFNGKGYLDFRRDFMRSNDPNAPDFFFQSPFELGDTSITIDTWRNYSGTSDPNDTLEWLNRLNFFEIEAENYLAGKETNWYDQVYTRGLRQNYDLSVSGTTANTSYFWSIGYTSNEGIVSGDKFKTIRSRLNLSMEVNSFIEIGINSQFSILDESAIRVDEGFVDALSPFGSKFDKQGNLRWFPHDYPLSRNPFINQAYQNKTNLAYNLFAIPYANIKLPFEINYRINFQNRFNFDRHYSFWPSNTYVGGLNHAGGFGSRNDASTYEWMIDNIFSWNKKFGNHSLDLTSLINAEKLKNWNSLQENENFSPNQNLTYHGLQFGINPTISNSDNLRTGDAMMFRINYGLKDRYLVTASIRRDGYSAFGQKSPRATFPALAVGWRISDESFMKFKSLDQLKIRASWGVNGNRDIGIYSALAQMNSLLYSDGTNTLVGVFNASMANPNLVWEQTESFNIGFDMGLFVNRLQLTADYYQMNTTNLLMDRRLPEITGFRDITTNLGRLDNRGLEVTVNTENIKTNRLNWNSGLVFSLNRNEIKRLWGDFEEVEVNGQITSREVPDYANRWFPGQGIDRIWDYDIIGVWSTDQFELAQEYFQRPGDFRARDVNDDGLYRELDDKVFLGWTRPRYRIGIRNQVNFSNFEFSCFLRSDLGHESPLNIFRHQESNLYHSRNTLDFPYWTPENQSNKYARLNADRSQFEGGYQIYSPRSFVRLQDVSLAYDFKKSSIEKFRFDRVKVFISARNLLTFTNWEGWDPESGNTPMPKLYTLGVNVSL